MATLQTITLTEPTQIASSPASVYANPASTKSLIRGIIIYNSNTTTETVKIYYVPDSSSSLGTAAASNRLFSVSLSADETLIIEIPFCLVLSDTNDAIFAETTTASKVTIEITGDQFV